MGAILGERYGLIASVETLSSGLLVIRAPIRNSSRTQRTVGQIDDVQLGNPSFIRRTNMEIAKIIGLFCAGFGLLKTRLRREERPIRLAIHARVQFVTLVFMWQQAV